MVSSFLETFANSSLNTHKKYSIELRTPGLNDKIEQSAIVSKDLLYEALKSLLLPLKRLFFSSKLMFPSSGDAAGFQAYCFRRNIPIPDSLTLTDIALDRVREEEDECLVIIGARNNVGDPVIRVIQSITEAYPSKVCILFNCDFSDKVTTGMTERTRRDNYKLSFQQIFYFRNIVSISRPSQIPLEKGALIYTPTLKWALFAVDESVIVGPGSLNRFMKTAAFARSPKDPTAFTPPRFQLAATFDVMPKRDEIDECLTSAAYKLERTIEREKKAVKFTSLKETLDALRSTRQKKRYYVCFHIL